MYHCIVTKKKAAGKYTCVSSDFQRGRKKATWRGDVYRPSGGGCGRSQWLRAAVNPPTNRFERVRARSRRTTCVPQGPVPTWRLSAWTFKVFRYSSLRPTPSGKQGMQCRGTTFRPRRRCYIGTCAVHLPAYYYDEWRQRSITRSVRTNINDDHEIITIIMWAPVRSNPPTGYYVSFLYNIIIITEQIPVLWLSLLLLFFFFFCL